MAPYVDIMLGRVKAPPSAAPQQNPQEAGDAASPKAARAAHLTGSVYDAFRRASKNGEVDLRRGRAVAYRKFLRKLGLMDIEDLTLLPRETDDDVFSAVYDTLDTWPQESGFFVLQALLSTGPGASPWGEASPAPLHDAPATRLWLGQQEEKIDHTLHGVQDAEQRLWLVSRQREMREIRERLEDILADPDRD